MTDYPIPDSCNRDYFIEQYPDLADVFRPKTKAQISLAQPSPRKPKRVVPPPLKPPERAGDVIVLWLPLPDAKLQPNRKASLHHMARAKITKGARQAAGFVAAIVRGPDHPWTEVRIDLTLWTAGRPDRDGCIGWVKSYVDALQDAGLIADDSGVHWGNVVRNTGKASGGRREVEIVVTKLE